MTANNLDNILVVKRTGDVVKFDPSKITTAIIKAYIDVYGREAASKMRHQAQPVTDFVCQKVGSRGTNSVAIETIQDYVELGLMRTDQLDVARSYILYREAHAQRRNAATDNTPQSLEVVIEGTLVTLRENDLIAMVAKHAGGLSVEPRKVALQVRRDLYNGCTMTQVRKAMVLAAKTLVETDPDYSRLAARQLIDDLYVEVIGSGAEEMDRKIRLEKAFVEGLQMGVEAELLNPELLKFDLNRLAAALVVERDEQFDLLGIGTLYDRYFLQVDKRRIEVPQGFFMRVAMGLALNETDRDGKAIEFYSVLSAFDFMSSTPTLFNSGSLRSQLASCYLTTIPDDLEMIYDGIKENALLQKFAGGLGNDWTPVRAMRSRIKGTNGESQGVVPFLKVVNDTAVAVNQGGKRKGAVCAYLESWHLDIEEFLELRKNVGDDRRRTHDMNTANWIPDLFMKRVLEKGDWTLFSPNEVPDLHETYGADFERAYVAYEQKADAGLIRLFKRLPAVDLWRKMLTMLFETGHAWMTFKDPCNVRSPQGHVGVVHSSNLCTEITLNTSETETAVCNLGSINLQKHIKDGALDVEKLQRTANIAMRMLDNVIDLNYYSVTKARVSNMRHRPVGAGIMGFQDALFELRVPYDSQQAVELADRWMEAVSYCYINASADLARERGSYETFDGSLWSKGILPIDSIALLEKERGMPIEVDRSMTLDWDSLRKKVMKGMRNSNVCAIAPTATIGNICNVDASIEPMFEVLSVKSNLAGEFTVLNTYLVDDLKRAGLWDAAMVMELKRDDGSIQGIKRIPESIRNLYKTAFEIGPVPLIEAAARRQKWIDQAQSLNIYMKGASGSLLDATYKLAWKKGLKTTYYLRTRSASSVEKSTVAAGALNDVALAEVDSSTFSGKACAIDNPQCESCQ